MQKKVGRDEGSANEALLEGMLYAFVLATLSVGVLLGLGLARLADLGHSP